VEVGWGHVPRVEPLRRGLRAEPLGSGSHGGRGEAPFFFTSGRGAAGENAERRIVQTSYGGGVGVLVQKRAGSTPIRTDTTKIMPSAGLPCLQAILKKKASVLMLRWNVLNTNAFERTTPELC
jgi:hypothetical protein